MAVFTPQGGIEKKCSQNAHLLRVNCAFSIISALPSQKKSTLPKFGELLILYFAMVSKSLRENASELERAVFLAVYNSRQQRINRFVAMISLIIKYISCGLILIWPVYLLFLFLILSPVSSEYIWYTLAFVPGLIFWLRIYLKSAMREYRRLVINHILNKGFIRELMFG